jgi:hypothetical protein
MSFIACRPKTLPFDKLIAAERRAIDLNPENAFDTRNLTLTPIGRRGGPRRIAVVTARKWPTTGVRLSVSFMDNASAALRRRILLHMNAWGQHANVLFSETQEIGEVRIARLDSPEDMAGYWSYIGTEILDIDTDQPTMNLEGFTMRTSDAEFRRVVRHEAGHTLGFDHEHMRSDIVKMIDREKAFAFYDEDQGWDRDETIAQVLTPLSKRSIMGTKESDPLSIMCYHLPGKIMKNKKPVPGGLDINPNDFAFAKKLYPKLQRRAPEETNHVVVSASPSFAAPAGDAGETFELVIMDDFQPGSGNGRSARTKSRFAQVFAAYGGARVMASMRLRKAMGETRTNFKDIIDVHKQIKYYTNRESGTLPDDDQMIDFGTKLFDTLFQGDVRRLYDEARTRQKSRLDIILTSMIPWIAEMPWEFAYDHGRKSFLATEETHFIRNVLTNVPADPISLTNGPLRILVVSAQPVGYGRLSIEQEEAVIKRGFEPLVNAKLVEIETLPRATPSMIHGHLTTGNYQVVHFIGHGVYDEKRNEGCLIFVNEDGTEYPLGERSVREIFRGRGLSLVFLNACESGRGGYADFNKGVAQSLVAHGLPALVANQYSVLDSSATSFAQHFYWSLAQGHSLGQAAREARIAVNYQLHGEPIDWAIPVLYARDPNRSLCTAPKLAMRVPVASMRATVQRSALSNRAGIAVWDMDNVFPALKGTLQLMNRVQHEFDFSLAEMSVPLGVWYLEENKNEKATPYLWAEKVAEKLQRMPMELGVQVLVCVTRQWMCDDDTFNIYGWWGSANPPIVIFSIAGFEELDAEGPETDRVLSNAIVTMLAGFYGDIGSHGGGAKSCPMWYNENRDFNSLTGEQKFDANCLKKLKPKLGAKLRALEALLKPFTY